jgi:hypothetical protein
MFCSNGHENSDGVRFCGTCGASMAGGMSGGQFGGGVSSVGSSGVNFQSLKAALMADLQQHRHSGHQMNLQATLSMVSGALFALAIVVVSLYTVSQSDAENPYTGAFVWSLLGVVASILVVRFVSKDLVAGATTAFVPLSIAAVIFLFGNQVGEGKTGLALIVIGLVNAAAWFLPVLRGRPALLTTALVTGGLGLLVLMVQSSITNSVDCGYYDECLDDPTAILTTASQKSATLMLILGIGLLAVAWVLDRKDWPQLGRTFIGVGIVFEVGGAFGVFESSSDKTAGALLLLVAGALLMAVAVRQTRKASLVIGGLGAVIGISAFVITMTEDNDGPTAFAILMIAISAGIGFLALKKSQAIVNSIQQRP